MRSIYKYDILEANRGIIEGPITKILYVGEQHGSIKVWAEVDTSKPNRKFQIMPIGTGWALDPANGNECVLDSHTYLGTVMIAGGNLVFHVYGAEILPVKKIDITKNEEKKVVDYNKSRSATFTCRNTKINPDVLKNFLN